MADADLLSTQEVAAIFKVGVSSVTRWVRKGTLAPAFWTPGGHARFRREDVEALRDKPRKEGAA